MTTLMEALAPRSDQLNADDLIAGPRVIKITDARIARDGRDVKIVLNYEGDNGKPWKPCKTMGRAMVMVWGITEPEQLVGKSVRLYREPTVTFGAQGEVGGIRISHMSHIDSKKVVKLTVSQGKKGNFEFSPLPTEVKEDAAAKWADGFIAELEGLRTVDAIAAHEANNAKGLKRLEDQRPELRARIQAAVKARFDLISPNDGSLSPENPTAGEGRADEDMGEATE